MRTQPCSKVEIDGILVVFEIGNKLLKFIKVSIISQITQETEAR